MNSELANFLREHAAVSRRYFLRYGSASLAMLGSMPLFASERERDPRLQRSLDALETWLTRPDDFRDVSRGTPLPHSLPLENAKRWDLPARRGSLKWSAIPRTLRKLGTP